MYQYKDIKPNLFTENGQVLFLRMRDHTKELLKKAGAVRMQEMMIGVGGGDTWDMLACADRMVELGELIELPTPSTVAQYRVFIAKP